MAILVPFRTLGHAHHGWLEAWHHFSFADYVDESRMHFGALRAWNDDRIAPHGGFEVHERRDMEIITYVRRGTLTRRDHLGHVGRTSAGSIHVVSAGTGVRYSERNDRDDPCELFRIWVLPRSLARPPRAAQRAMPTDRPGAFVPVASGDPMREGALFIDADATLFSLRLRAGEHASHALGVGRIAYGVASAGRGTVNRLPFRERDGFTVEFEDHVHVRAEEDLELCLLEVGGPAASMPIAP